MRGISLSLVAVGTLIATGFSQQPTGPAGKAPQAESTVEDLLTAAMKMNSDIQTAEAKVREAEAELRRTKVSVINNVISARLKLDAAKSLAASAEQEFAMQSRMKQQGAGTDSDFRRAEAQLRQARIGAEEAEAFLNTLTGRGAEKYQNLIGASAPLGGLGLPGHGVILGGGVGEGDGRPIRPPHPGMAEKIRKALDMPIKAVDFQETPLKEVISFYRELSKDVPFVDALGGQADHQITLKLGKELSLGAHLQALQDVAPGLIISVRNYGFFLTFDIPPDDGMSYLDFWHGKTDGKAELRNKPE